MIRINLLPVREARRQAELRNQVVMLATAVGLGVLISGGLHAYGNAQIGDYKRAIAQKNIELTKLKEMRTQVEEFQRERDEIERKLNIIASLERGRFGQARLMDEIATRIPQRMWLTALDAKEGALAIEGRSVDAEIVATLLSSLEDSPMIEDVVLLETSLQEAEGLKLNSFKLRARYPFVRVESSPRTPAPKGGHDGNRRGR